MLTNSCNRSQNLLKLVQDELHRIVVDGQGPPIFAYTPDPEGPRLTEVNLAVKVEEQTNARQVLQLGSFTLVPELLDRLKAIQSLPLAGRVAPLLYALREVDPKNWTAE